MDESNNRMKPENLFTQSFSTNRLTDTTTSGRVVTSASAYLSGCSGMLQPKDTEEVFKSEGGLRTMLTAVLYTFNSYDITENDQVTMAGITYEVVSVINPVNKSWFKKVMLRRP
jgi:hypothetical protein